MTDVTRHRRETWGILGFRVTEIPSAPGPFASGRIRKELEGFGRSRDQSRAERATSTGRPTVSMVSQAPAPSNRTEAWPSRNARA
jgi:hypothetical protein